MCCHSRVEANIQRKGVIKLPAVSKSLNAQPWGGLICKSQMLKLEASNESRWLSGTLWPCSKGLSLLWQGHLGSLLLGAVSLSTNRGRPLVPRRLSMLPVTVSWGTEARESVYLQILVHLFLQLVAGRQKQVNLLDSILGYWHAGRKAGGRVQMTESGRQSPVCTFQRCVFLFYYIIFY